MVKALLILNCPAIMLQLLTWWPANLSRASHTSSCTAGDNDLLGDGGCNSINNNADCDYDGGDCCSCTCQDDAFACGSAGYDCLDPDADCDYANCSGAISFIGNGYCTFPNNNADCDYDGGDCCPCTCQDSIYPCGIGGYNCQDPTAGDCYYPECPGYMASISSGMCTAANNNADCGYDGGDCCPCTCQDGLFSCGSAGYDCQDPSAECHYPDCGGDSSSIADGNCTAVNNNADCGYDGGDCCSCTCQDGVYYCGSWGQYDCQDPDADCEYPNCILNATYIGDGYCDSIVSNDTECDYDGGDCCSCTCQDSLWFPCGGFLGYDCHDPDADCDYPNCAGNASLIGDGHCTDVNNNDDCDFDGGDCCSCTCLDGPSFTCGSGGYDCQDPGAECHYSNCTGYISLIGNGYCNAFNNNADCGYDDGDCCPCTCRDGLYTCGFGGYYCQDPNGDCDHTDCAGETLSIGDGNCTAVNNNDDCGYDGGDCCPCTCVGSLCGLDGDYDCQDPDASCFPDDEPGTIYDAAFFSSVHFIVFIAIYVCFLAACWRKIVHGKICGEHASQP